MSEGTMLGLHHIGLYTPDIEASVAFYEKIGFAVSARFAQPTGLKIAFINVGSCCIELLQPTEAALAQRGAGIVDHIAVEVKNLAPIVARLREAGIAFLTEAPNQLAMFAHGSQCIFFEGPSGERLELFEVYDA